MTIVGWFPHDLGARNGGILPGFMLQSWARRVLVIAWLFFMSCFEIVIHAATSNGQVESERLPLQPAKTPPTTP
jgi:hypothetical protein